MSWRDMCGDRDPSTGYVCTLRIGSHPAKYHEHLDYWYHETARWPVTHSVRTNRTEGWNAA